MVTSTTETKELGLVMMLHATFDEHCSVMLLQHSVRRPVILCLDIRSTSSKFTVVLMGSDNWGGPGGAFPPIPQ